jgi:hypothetical protein
MVPTCYICLKCLEVSLAARTSSTSAEPVKEQIHIGQHPGPTVQWDARKPSGSCPLLTLSTSVFPIFASRLRSTAAPHRREHIGCRFGRRDPRTPPPPRPPPNGRRRPQIEGGAGGACRSRSGGRAWTRSPPPPWRARCPRSSCWTSRAASSSGATTAETSPRSRPSASSPSSSTRRYVTDQPHRASPAVCS